MDLILGILCIILGIGIFVISGNYDVYTYDPLGGGGFPRLLAVLIILCGIAIAVQYFMGKKAGKEQKLPKGNWILAGKLLISLIVYVLVVERVGYLVSTVILVSLLLYWQDIKNKKKLLLCTGVIVGVLYVLFAFVLQVKLPTGILI